MRYRKLDQSGDMTFGHAQDNFWIDQPEGVAQWVMTRLRLFLGEWFADTSDGTAWNTQVLGERTRSTRDLVVRDRVRLTPHVTDIVAYDSTMDVNVREWTARMTITTDYGAALLAAAKLPGAQPPLTAGYVIPASRSLILSLAARPGMDISSTPAALIGSGPNPNIADFLILRRDAGAY